MIRHIRFAITLVTALIAFTSFSAVAQSGRTFYIDSVSGSNSNPGTLASPWKSAPYMNHSAACDGGSGPSYSHSAGDRFVFKGGDTWGAACFGIIVSAGAAPSARTIMVSA